MLYKDRKKNWHKKHMFNDLTNRPHRSAPKSVLSLLTPPSLAKQTTFGGVMICSARDVRITNRRFHDVSQIKVHNNIFKYRDITSLLTSPLVTSDARSEKRSFVTTPYIITAVTVLKNTKVASKGGLGRPPLPAPLDPKPKWLKSAPTPHIVTPPKKVLKADRRNDLPKSPKGNTTLQSPRDVQILNKVPTSHNMTHTALTSPEVQLNDKPKVVSKRYIGSNYRSPKGYFSKRAKKRKIKGILGKIYVSSTKNNTIITLIDKKGDTKGWSCSGSLGFKNARKSTTYAAQAAAENIVKKAKALGYTHLRLLVKGLGRGKQSCLRALSKCGLKIISVEDQTAIPYNGCRLSKKRRV